MSGKPALADWTKGEAAIVYQSCSACGGLQYFRRGFCAACGAPRAGTVPAWPTSSEPAGSRWCARWAT